LLIVEDEAYAYLAGDAPEPVAALAPERTIFVSSLSKSVATGLRFGFLVAPSGLVAPIESAIRATVWNVAAALSAIACRWMEDGTVAELEARKRKEAAVRQDMAAKALAGIRVVSHSSSYLLWVPLGEDQRADRVSVELRRRGIAVATADAFATTAHVPHAVRIAMGSVTRRVLKEALVAVGDVIRADVS
jgi:DNA-binding transcriptional MocR family regulator